MTSPYTATLFFFWFLSYVLLAALSVMLGFENRQR